MPWQDHAVVDDVVLLPEDDKVTEVGPKTATEIEVARGLPVTLERATTLGLRQRTQ